MAKKTKDDLIQEVQNKGLEFDGNMTVEELQAVLDRAEEPVDPMVQPLTAREDGPVEEQPVPVLSKERCWNCYAQDRKTRNMLDKNGVCEVCGFEKGQLYNGTIEADKAAQRLEAARAA